MMSFMVALGLFREVERRIFCLKMALRTDECTQKMIKEKGGLGTLSGHWRDTLGIKSELKEVIEEKEEKKGMTSLPKGFRISDRVRKWAQEKGHTHLEAHLEHFVGYAKAKGYRAVDWDQAFMNAIRGNWAKLDTSSAGGKLAGVQFR